MQKQHIEENKMLSCTAFMHRHLFFMAIMGEMRMFIF